MLSCVHFSSTSEQPYVTQRECLSRGPTCCFPIFVVGLHSPGSRRFSVRRSQTRVIRELDGGFRVAHSLIVQVFTSLKFLKHCTILIIITEGKRNFARGHHTGMDSISAELTQQRDGHKVPGPDMNMEQVACTGEMGVLFLHSTLILSFS